MLGHLPVALLLLLVQSSGQFGQLPVALALKLADLPGEPLELRIRLRFLLNALRRERAVLALLLPCAFPR